MIRIETERLILREFLDSDVNSLFELDSDPLVHKYLGNKPIKDKNECVNYIKHCKEQYKTKGICRLALIEKETNSFIGWSGLRFYEKEVFNNRTHFYDVGYRLIPKYWGKGYATESGKASVDYAFNVMQLETIYGITEMGNEASHNSLLKIGLDYIEDFYYEKEELMLRWYSIKNK